MYGQLLVEVSSDTRVLEQPSATSSLRLHTQTEELGPDTSSCTHDRGFLCSGEHVIVVPGGVIVVETRPDNRRYYAQRAKSSGLPVTLVDDH